MLRIIGVKPLNDNRKIREYFVFIRYYFGMDLDAITLRFGTCGAIQCEPGWSWEPPIFTDFDLWYVWAGDGTLTIDGKNHPAFPGSLFCLHPGMRVIGNHDPRHPLGVCYVHFDLPATRHRQQLIRVLASRFVTQMADVQWIERLARQVVRRVHEGRPPCIALASLYLKSLLGEFMLASMSGPTRPMSEPHRMIHNLAANLRENPSAMPSVSELADRAGYQVDHFSSLFKNVIGESPRQYCVRLRIERAKMLLIESSTSVSRIAAALGYTDVFFFSRQFKQHTGRTATQWRAGQGSGG